MSYNNNQSGTIVVILAWMLWGKHIMTFWFDLRPAPQNEVLTSMINPAMNPWYEYHRSKGEPTITILLNRHYTKLTSKYLSLHPWLGQSSAEEAVFIVDTVKILGLTISSSAEKVTMECSVVERTSIHIHTNIPPRLREHNRRKGKKKPYWGSLMQNHVFWTWQT